MNRPSTSSSGWEVRHVNDPQALAREAARDWLELLAHLSPQGPVTAALSGGRIAQGFFAELVEQSRANPEPLRNVHWFWTDERCVPPGHAESNYRVAQQWLFEPLGCPAARIHRIQGEEVPERASDQASRELQAMATKRTAGAPLLDLVFLGTGEDGHVASLFPGKRDALTRTDLFFPVYDSPKPPPVRVTMGFFPIVGARRVFLLAAGEGKRAVLTDVLERGCADTPVGAVLASRSGTMVYTDCLSHK